MSGRLKLVVGVVLIVVVVLPSLGIIVPVARMNAAVGSVRGKKYELAMHDVGTAAREWPAGHFRPAAGWPCARSWERGRVMLVVKWDRGWYIFFDENDVAVETVKTKS